MLRRTVPRQPRPCPDRPPRIRLQYGAPHPLWLLVPPNTRPHEPAPRRLTWLMTSRLLSPPLPSSPRLRPTSRLLSLPLPSSARLRPTSRLLSPPLRRSPWPRPLPRSPPPSLRHSLWEKPLRGLLCLHQGLLYLHRGLLYLQRGLLCLHRGLLCLPEDCYVYTHLPHCVVAVASKRTRH